MTVQELVARFPEIPKDLLQNRPDRSHGGREAPEARRGPARGWTDR